MHTYTFEIYNSRGHVENIDVEARSIQEAEKKLDPYFDKHPNRYLFEDSVCVDGEEDYY